MAVARPPRNVLFLCTGNSARSVIAEAILRHEGQGRFRAYSAGSRPMGAVHPLALEVLRENGLSTNGLHSKGWDTFAQPDAPRMDVVITVCDAAAREACPVWPGAPITAHWGLADPVLSARDQANPRRADLPEGRRPYASLRTG